VRRAIVGGLMAVAVVLAALAASFALLGYATTGSDPVGTLSLRTPPPPHAHPAATHAKVRRARGQPLPTRSAERDLPDD
jgi:hypothetical protein